MSLVTGQQPPPRSPYPEPALKISSKKSNGAELKELQTALGQARAALPGWRGLSIQDRRSYLKKLSKQLHASALEWADEITQENGKPITEAYGAELCASLEGLGQLIRFGPGWLGSRAVPLQILDRLRGVDRIEVLHEPVGVVGIIGTWNYPLAINLSQIASALLCGNTVLFKPSELTPKTSARLKTLFEQAGFPKGVFQVLPTDRSMGQALVQAGCDLILFTGSGKTGAQVLEGLASQKIPAILELSGMDAALICKDAPIQEAAQGLCWATMTNAGQSCVASRRILVHKKIAPDFLLALTQAVGSLRLGDPNDPETEIGPLRSEAVLSRLETLVEDAIAQGARLLVGGGRWKEREGLYYQPTLLADVTAAMAISQEEFFGPVAWVDLVESDDHLVEVANQHPYGLGASIWSRDLARAQSLARRLESGMVWINDCIYSAADMRFPFGGVKASGFGRVHGPEGLWGLTRTKTIETNQPSGFRPYRFPYSEKKLKQLRQFLTWRYR